MKDYIKMSDFELNSAVAQLSLWKKKDCEEIHGDEKRGVVSWADGANWHVFDPCNNPSDAWPIIIANKIRISPVMHMSDDNGEYLCNGEWEAGTLWSEDGAFYNSKYHCFSDENPLKAAMIVYLMMKDEEK